MNYTHLRHLENCTFFVLFDKRLVFAQWKEKKWQLRAPMILIGKFPFQLNASVPRLKIAFKNICMHLWPFISFSQFTCFIFFSLFYRASLMWIFRDCVQGFLRVISLLKSKATGTGKTNYFPVKFNHEIQKKIKILNNSRKLIYLPRPYRCQVPGSDVVFFKRRISDGKNADFFLMRKY